MSDEMIKALLEMEEAGWSITGGSKLPEYEERKAEIEEQTND
jgi:hypothetical protein